MSRRTTTTEKLRTHELWGAARYMAIKILPYLSKGIFGLRDRPIVDFAPNGAYPIAVTERGVVLWDPQWWTSRGPAAPAMLGCAMLHECGHWLQRHAKRRGDREKKRFNVSGDMEIDDDLLPAIENYFSRRTKENDAVMKFVRTWIFPSSFNLPNGLLAEWYYNQIPTSPSPSDGEGDEGDGEGQPQRSPRERCCGSGAGNPHPKEGEEEARQADEQMGHSESASEVIRYQVALDIKAHEQSLPFRGTERGGWFRWADEELKPPKLRWQDVTARVIRRVITTVLGNTDTSFAYPSRRQACVGIGPGKPIFPALVSPMPEVDLVIDTSGSMGQVQFVDAASEIVAILRTLHTANFRFHTVDTDVHVSIPVRNIRDVLRTRLPGGGGTDFCSLFEMLSKRRPLPNLAIVFTDGYASVPETPPPFPTIFVLVGKYVSELPWGINIRAEAA